MRHSLYFPGGWHWAHGGGPLDGLIKLGFFVMVVWMADHFVPGFHEFLLHLLTLMHRAVDFLREWWHSTQSRPG
jgi:hypothetical protein